MANQTPQGPGVVGRTYNAIMGAALRYRLWPALSGAAAGTGAVLTQGAAVWGAWANIVAAAAITTDFWAYGLRLYTTSGIVALQWEVSTGAAGADIIGQGIMDSTAVTLNQSAEAFGPYPVWLPGSTQVQGRVGGTVGAKTVNVHLQYAILL